MNLEESLNKLYSLHQFGVKLGLEKPKQLFSFIGDPQKKLNCFHIAGSNAKGSVASFISSMLIEEGYSVGLYTSPHFVKFNERIRINGEMISDEYVMDFMNELDEFIDKNEPTFFELTTAMAFKYFEEQNVDYTVVETGLGGRLDATNVIDPIASIITTISLEHTNILGNTIEQIAFEKGEIIKPKRKAVIGFIPNNAKMKIEEKCKREDAELVNIEDYSNVTDQSLELEFNQKNYHIYSTPLHGKFQRKNAALAVLALLSSIKLKSDLSIFRGINNVVVNSGIQGRYEVFNEKPRVIFDSSHNTEGVENFISEFKKEMNDFEKCEIIFGVMKDKDISGMLYKFDNIFDKIYITSFDYERAATIKQVTAISDEINIRVEGLKDPVDYIISFMKNGENKCLVVLGSIYLLGDIKSKLLQLGT